MKENHTSLSLNSTALAYSNSLIGEINKICDPLFLASGIKYFVYHQYVSSKEFLHLGTSETVNNLYLRNCGKGFTFHTAMQSCPMDDFYFFLWPITKMDHSLYVIYGLNIFYGLTVYFRQKDFMEAWHFATDTNNHSVMNFYINKKSLIKQFILHFKESISHISDLNQSGTLAVFPEHIDLAESISASSFQIDAVNPELINILGYCLEAKISCRHLSKRELECLFLLAQGKTAKEIGRILKLSYRTVEFYIVNIKNKTGNFTRTALRDLVQDTLQKWL